MRPHRKERRRFRQEAIQLLELFHALSDGLMKMFFLYFNNLFQVISVFHAVPDMRLRFPVTLRYYLEERALDPQQSAMACSAAKQSS